MTFDRFGAFGLPAAGIAARSPTRGRSTVRRVLVALATTTVLTLAGSPAPALAAAVPGAPGIGDSYFPDYGNGGYDVSHYDVRLRYFPDIDKLTGTTTILARANEDLSSFNLDFLLDVSSVRVNGRVAGFARSGDHELVVTPERALTRGQQVTVVVQYSGVPSSKVGAGATAWVRTPDGALAVGEPEIAWWWFPSNDHPLDKATYDISVAVPDGVEVLSNGVMPRRPAPEIQGWTRWSWRSTQPMATYLAFLAIGQYDIRTDTAPNGQQVINAYSTTLPQDFAEAARSSVERTAEVVEFLSRYFGPYPFEAQGGVVVPQNTLGFALENQTRPVYSPAFFTRGSNTYVVVHEQAHQWFGDSVAVADWRHIWLNEGFASYAEWLWSEAQGEGTAQEVFDFTYAQFPADHVFWTVKPGDPGPAAVFDSAVYDRGAMTLHQLRRTIGDNAFFTLIKQWANERKHGNATTDQFIALAEKVSGQQLDDLFNTWLFTPSRPALAPGGLASFGARAAAPKQPKSWATIQQTRELLQH
jgi:aminopeptidase N